MMSHEVLKQLSLTPCNKLNDYQSEHAWPLMKCKISNNKDSGLVITMHKHCHQSRDTQVMLEKCIHTILGTVTTIAQSSTFVLEMIQIFVSGNVKRLNYI